MAILIEGISIVIRRNALEKHIDDFIIAEKFNPWWMALDSYTDNTLVCISNQNPSCADNLEIEDGDVFIFPNCITGVIEALERTGCTFMKDGQAIDIAIVDSISGILTPVSWLNFTRISINDGEGEVGACWSHNDAIPSDGLSLSASKYWGYTDSPSKKDYEAIQLEKSKIDNEKWWKDEDKAHKIKINKGINKEKINKILYN